MSLNDCNAIVTGGAQGIGRACVEALIAGGARVAIADLKLAEASATAAAFPGKAIAIACDVANPDDVIAMVDRAEAELGPISVLVNNAGIAIGEDFLQVSVESFQKVLSVNLLGTFVAMQTVAKRMIAHGLKGSIVNMSSINAILAIPAIASYCASKGGVAQLTKAAALALAPHGIRVNAVGPGSIMTDMLRGVANDPAAMRNVLSRTPLGRIGDPMEIGNVVAFLAGDNASYITGETIFVDGGRLALNYTV